MLDIVWLLLLVLAGAALMTAGYAYRLAQLEVQRHLPVQFQEPIAERHALPYYVWEPDVSRRAKRLYVASQLFGSSFGLLVALLMLCGRLFVPALLVGTVGLVGVIYGVALLMRHWPALK